MWPSGWPWPSTDRREEHGAGGAPVAAAELAAPRRRAAATDARRPNDDPRQCGPAAGPGRRRCGGKIPRAEDHTNIATRREALDCDEPAAGRLRPLRDC